MTKKEFMTKHRPEAMDIAYKQMASKTNFWLSALEQERDLILDEWWYDYEHERI